MGRADGSPPAKVLRAWRVLQGRPPARAPHGQGTHKKRMIGIGLK